LSAWSLEALRVNPSNLEEATSDGSKTPVHPESIGGDIATNPPDLSDLVLFERSPGRAQIQELPRSQVVRALLGYSFNHYKQPEEAFRLTTGLARHCTAWLLNYERPGDAAALLKSQLS
jgi:hypothetical protein